ncbi:hypothetical protein BC830DRAFT_1086446, partial [Chytriomyces sp. MP71]
METMLKRKSNFYWLYIVVHMWLMRLNEIPDLHGTTAIVTGANSGLGLASVKMMAAKGTDSSLSMLHLVAISTDAKALEAIASVKKDIPDADVHFMALDLADWDS